MPRFVQFKIAHVSAKNVQKDVFVNPEQVASVMRDSFESDVSRLRLSNGDQLVVEGTVSKVLTMLSEVSA